MSQDQIKDIYLEQCFNIADKTLPKFKTYDDMLSYINDEGNKAKFSMIQNKMNRVIEPTIEEDAFYMHYRKALDIRNHQKVNEKNNDRSY